MKGRLKTYIEFSDDLCVNCFRGQSPRYGYGVSVVNRLCSVGYAHEPLEIPANRLKSQTQKKQTQQVCFQSFRLIQIQNRGGVNVLHVVQIFQRVNQFLHFDGIVAGEFGFVYYEIGRASCRERV